MKNKKIMIAVLVLVICVTSGVILMLNTINYERVDITHNGTSIHSEIASTSSRFLFIPIPISRQI